MKSFGALAGIATIILALFYGTHLLQQDKVAIAKARTECVCKENVK